jgi:uncharacterized protein YbjT (DUF2867 family)
VPVVVAHAASPLGHAIVSGLLEAGAEVEVRATVRRVEERRWFLDRGVPVAVTDLDDAELLAAVLTGAHTLVLLPLSLSLPALPALGAVLLESLADTGVRRVVVVGAPDTSWVPAVGLDVELCPVLEAASVAATAAAVLAADARA